MNQQRYWLFKRGRVYYIQDTQTGKQQSLFTKNHKEAQRLRNARNDSQSQPQLNLALARTYLAAHDAEVSKRTWRDVMELMASDGKESTKQRCHRAMQSRAFDSIRDNKLIETTGDDLLRVISQNGSATNHYLRRFHNLAVGLGWLPWPILATRLWPKSKSKHKRAITWEEHNKIIDTEKNEERRLYCELLWELGASQSDAADLSADNIDRSLNIIRYHRKKLSKDLPPACLVIGDRMKKLLEKLPGQGQFFPHISRISSNHRAAEFRRKCKVLGISGISLHSYRYAWAQRAQAAGYPERYAQNALGHNSRAVHQTYAQGATVVCPSLEEYERKTIRDM